MSLLNFTIPDPRYPTYQRSSRMPSSALFHYTDRSGFLGILTSGEMWATNVAYLNDAKEVAYGRELIMKALATKYPRPYEDPDERMNELSIFFEALAEVQLYVLCFCEDGDALSQWRAYAPGGGYSIGITPRAIDAIGRACEPNITNFAPVIYDIESQNDLVESLLIEVEELVRKADTSRWANPNAPMAEGLAKLLNMASALMKHPSFREEREWRFIVMPVDSEVGTVRFRAGRTLLTPYLPVPLKSRNDDEYDAFSDLEMVVGPTPHEDLALRAAISLIESKQNPWTRPATNKRARFRNSQIPYRDW